MTFRQSDNKIIPRRHYFILPIAINISWPATQTIYPQKNMSRLIHHEKTIISASLVMT